MMSAVPSEGKTRSLASGSSAGLTGIDPSPPPSPAVAAPPLTRVTAQVGTHVAPDDQPLRSAGAYPAVA